MPYALENECIKVTVKAISPDAICHRYLSNLLKMLMLMLMNSLVDAMAADSIFFF